MRQNYIVVVPCFNLVLLSMRHLLAVALLLLANPLLAFGDNTIAWQTYHRPPGIIKTGAHDGQGFVQKSLDLIIKELPEYQHEMPLTTLARSLSDMKAGRFVCHPALFKTAEREKFMYFSQASMINPTSRIVAHDKKIEPLVRNGAVDLAQLLQQANMTFALVKGRSYTQPIDDILAQYLNKNVLFEMTSTDLEPLFKMVALGRIDVTIAYPFEVNYYIKNSPVTALALNVYAIAGMAQFSFGSVACPKNEWGKQIIEQVNTALKALKPKEEYKRAVTTWWEGERDNPQFEAFYQDVFLRN